MSLPDFLAAEFDAPALDTSLASIAVLDPAGMIRWVNRAWRRRAEAHRLQGPLTEASYFASISPPLREYFEEAFFGAVAEQAIFEVDYECPTPEEQRTFHLRALPIHRAGLLVEHSLVVSAAAEPGDELIEGAYCDLRGLITQCSNCRRVRHPASEAWHWVPALVKETRPEVSHGLCATCVGYFWTQRSAKRAHG